MVNYQDKFDKAVEGKLLAAAANREIAFTRNFKLDAKPGGLNLTANWHLRDSFNNGNSALIFKRFQDRNGSTEEKLTSLLIRLKVAIDENSDFRKAWVVLGGNGWTGSYLEFLSTDLGELVPNLFDKIELVLSEDELDGCDFSDF